MSDTLEVKIGASDAGLEATLKTVQAELANMEAKVKSGDLTFNELEKTMRRMGQVEGLEKKLKAIGDESSGTSPKVDELGRDLEKMGNRGNDAGDKSSMSLGKIGIAAGVAGVAVKAGMALAEGAMDAARAVADGFGQAIDLGGRLTDLSSRTGETSGSLLVLERAFTNTGVSSEAVGTSLNKMQKFMTDAAQGGAAQSEAMQRLGLTMGDLAGKTPTEQMAVFAQRISSIQDPAQRAEAAMSIFGKSGGELLPILNNFSGELEGARDQLGGLPGVMDRSAAAFDATGDSMAAINSKVMEFAAGFLEEALPALTTFTNALGGIDAAGWGQKAMDTIRRIADTLIGAFKNPLEAIQAWGLAYESGYKSLGNGLVNAALTFTDFLMKSFQTNLPRAITSYVTSGLVDSSLTFSRYLVQALMTFSEGLSTLPGFEGMAGKMFDALSSVNEGIIAQQLDNMGKTEAAAAKVVEEFGKAAEKTTVFKEDFFGAEESTARMNDKFSELAASGAATRESLTTAMVPVEEGAKKVTAEMQTQLDTTAKIKASKQDELAFELAMAEAKGTGNKEEIEALTKKKEWLDAWKKAIASGMGEEQAAAFANNLAAAKINADNIKPPAFTTAKEDAQAMENALGGSKSFLEAMGKIEKSKAVEEAKLDAQAARAEIEAFGQYMNVDLQNMSFADIAKKLGVRDLSLTGKEQLKEIIDFVGESKDKLAVNPIDSDAFNSTWQGIQDTITGNKTILPLEANTTTAEQQVATLANPKTVEVNADITKAEEQLAGLGGGVAVELDAEQSIENIRDQLKEGIELDIAAKNGTSGLLSEIKGLVDLIKTAVEKIEPKLPVAALVA
jgi:hypothetical protein